MTQRSDLEHDAPHGKASDRAPSPVARESSPPPIHASELVHSPRTYERPIWTSIVVCAAAIVLSAIVSGIVLVIAATADRGADVLNDVTRLKSWVEEFGQTREGLLVMLLPSQTVFLLVACGAAALSPRPFVRRLSLGTGVLPLWTWVVFVIGTPIVGIVSSEVLSLVVDDLSDNLKLIESMMRSHLSSSLPLLLVLVAVVPGVVEEVLFRGYLQTRLVERWSPIWAITVGAVIFAAAHMDPLHGIGILPLGLWLGAVAWRTDSIWPAALCHTANNTVAVLGMKFQPDEKIGVALDELTIGALIVCTPAFLFSLYLFRNR